MTELELLAPARNLECGIAAIDHGADAVYIGAEQFGARAAAGNSIDDIRRLCLYAHRFRAKVMVAVNTIVFDNELEATNRLLKQLKDAGVDAVIAQDMAVFEMAKAWHLPVHASTQTDNRSADKVVWLRDRGASRVVLARELALEDIAAIHRQVPEMELEVFVHGALCVSYSGLCYASQCFLHRSANRGTCAQFCRLAFDLVDATGRLIERKKHLLSLKDMNRLEELERLAEAGAVSFKIEGRLKDAGYVKNVTAAYSEKLDAIVRKHPDRYCRASLGRCHCSFTPDIQRSFNRGFTTYFLHGRTADVASFDTPKAVGQFVGHVKEVKRQTIRVAGICSFANGDGLCFMDADRQLVGFRVNRVEGNLLFPLKMPQGIRVGMSLYRNNDQNFEKSLAKSGGNRKIAVCMKVTEEGLSAKVEGRDIEVSLPFDTGFEQAVKSPVENIRAQMSKLGNTIFECTQVQVAPDFCSFIPSSVLTQYRRQLVERLEEVIMESAASDPSSSRLQDEHMSVLHSLKEPSQRAVTKNDMFAPTPYYRRYPYLYNIANARAKEIYAQCHLSPLREAYEVKAEPMAVLMQCRHCIRYSLGHCVKNGGSKADWKEPLYLVAGDGRRFRLEFDCGQCQMNVIHESFE